MKQAQTLAPPAAGRGAMLPALIVYAGGVLHGLVLVSFPASSTVLRSAHGFTDAQYGSAFLPQVVLAVIGAVGGGAAARRLGLRALLLLSLLAAGASQLVLATTTLLPHGWAFGALLIGTGLLGLGFGLAGAPLNAWPARLFPAKGGTALVAMHTAIGLGLTGGPLLAAVLMAQWVAFPVSLLVIALLLAGAAAGLPAEDAAHSPAERGGGSAGSPARSPAFWVFVAVAVLYAFAEGTFSNWAVVFLKEGRGLSDDVAAAGLSVFWGALVAGRLVASVLLLRVPAAGVWAVLPAGMVAVFLALPWTDGAATGIGAFALAGLACSAFFPLTVELASRRFERHVPWVASMLTAALMLGVGAGSFVVGGLRAMLSFDALYPASAVYPAAVLVLVALLWRAGVLSRRGRP